MIHVIKAFLRVEKKIQVVKIITLTCLIFCWLLSYKNCFSLIFLALGSCIASYFGIPPSVITRIICTVLGLVIVILLLVLNATFSMSWLHKEDIFYYFFNFVVVWQVVFWNKSSWYKCRSYQHRTYAYQRIDYLLAAVNIHWS